MNDNDAEQRFQGCESWLPSFGASLEKFRAMPATPPSRRLGRQTVPSSASPGRVTRSVSAASATSKVKLEDPDAAAPWLDDDAVEASKPESPYLPGQISEARPSPRKKRRIKHERDTSAFEGMAEVPDRLAEDLDSGRATGAGGAEGCNTG
jgi:hypothetical protein